MNPAIMRRSVVLPQPEGPSRKNNSPASMVSETLSTATVARRPLPPGAGCAIEALVSDSSVIVVARAQMRDGRVGNAGQMVAGSGAELRGGDVAARGKVLVRSAAAR